MWNPTPEEAYAAKALAGSWIGGSIAMMWKRGLAWLERGLWGLLSFGMGLLLGPFVSKKYGFPIEATSLAVSLIGLTVAFGLMQAASKFDFTEVLKAILGVRK